MVMVTIKALLTTVCSSTALVHGNHSSYSTLYTRYNGNGNGTDDIMMMMLMMIMMIVMMRIIIMFIIFSFTFYYTR